MGDANNELCLLSRNFVDAEFAGLNRLVQLRNENKLLSYELDDLILDWTATLLQYRIKFELDRTIEQNWFLFNMTIF